jgi:hypothetical protein
MKQPPDRDPRPAPGTRTPEYVAELWTSHQLKDKIHHLDPAPGAAQVARQIRPPEPELRGRAVTTSYDHANEPATSHEPAGASHHTEAAARRAEEYARAARSVDCECQARAGTPCGPAGDHLARYVRAHHAGALTKDSLTDVIAELDVIAPRALIQPPGERADPARTATTAGHAPRGQASAESNPDRAGAPAHSAARGRARAPAPAGQEPRRSDRGASTIYARQDRELEAGS